MKKTAIKCDDQCGVVLSLAAPAATASGMGPYSEATHWTIIAMQCATSHRPFNIVNDKYYRMEIELLRPGTKIPAAKTVLFDIKHLYLELSKDVRTYFKVSVFVYLF